MYVNKKKNKKKIAKKKKFENGSSFGKNTSIVGKKVDKGIEITKSVEHTDEKKDILRKEKQRGVERKEYGIIDWKKVIITLGIVLIFLTLLFFWFFKYSKTNVRTIDSSKKGNDIIINKNSNLTEKVESVKNKTDSAVVINNGKNKKDKIKAPRLFKISEEKTAGVEFVDKIAGEYRIKFFTVNGITYEAKTNVIKDGSTNVLNSKESFREVFDEIYDVKWLSKTKRMIVYADRFGKKKVVISDSVGNKNILLPGRVNNVSVSDSGKIFYLIDKNNKAEGYVFNPFTNKTKKVFESGLTQWKSSWRSGVMVLIYPKNISKRKGISYLVNVNSGSFVKDHGGLYNLQGLISPDSSKIVYFGKKNAKSDQQIYIKDLKTKKIKELGFKTFAEKCTWSKNNINMYCSLPKVLKMVTKKEPDDWYKGLSKFEDKVININTVTGEVVELFDPEDYRYNMDITKINLSSNDEYLYFTDKNTLKTWGYKIR